MRVFAPLFRIPLRSEPSFMSGRGSRGDANTKLTGMTIKDLKHHYALTPLFAIMAFGGVLVFANIWRAFFHVPDINFYKVDAADLHDKWKHRKVKMVDTQSKDFKELGEQVPDWRKC
mmetsp:Transcript_16491/g.27258  ORF Transcript_16491/g.27258 Transcript_16491/m.27258 type:complete len:117 (-) Transcript_16491:108-458(-)